MHLHVRSDQRAKPFVKIRDDCESLGLCIRRAGAESVVIRANPISMSDVPYHGLSDGFQMIGDFGTKEKRGSLGRPDIVPIIFVWNDAAPHHFRNCRTKLLDNLPPPIKQIEDQSLVGGLQLRTRIDR